jgi:biopolymer transport protein ExbD
MDLGSGSGRGSRRTLDASLNLVPFIDLMAVTIVFLIMTAVWTQLGRLQASTPAQGPCSGCEAPAPIPRVQLTSTTVTVALDAQVLFEGPLTRRASGRLELTALTASLAAWKAQSDGSASVRLAPDDDVSAADVVQVMDVLAGVGFPDLSLE